RGSAARVHRRPRGPGRDRDRRHRHHRARRHPRGLPRGLRQGDPGLRRALPVDQLLEDRHLDHPVAGHRGRRERHAALRAPRLDRRREGRVGRDPRDPARRAPSPLQLRRAAPARERALTRALPLLLVALVGACGERAAPSPSPSPSPTVSECALDPVQRWMDDGGSLALAMNADGGLALSLRDGAPTARPLSADGSARGPEATSSLAGAQALLALAPRGDRYLLIARGSCDESARCLIARLLDAAGAPAGAPTRVALPDPIRTSRRAGEGALLFAWSTTSGHRALERFTA